MLKYPVQIIEQVLLELRYFDKMTEDEEETQWPKKAAS